MRFIVVCLRRSVHKYTLAGTAKPLTSTWPLSAKRELSTGSQLSAIPTQEHQFEASLWK
jgi:hypothetical protein